jgi:TetR/AcrR family transcriptional regulator, upper aerobic nicotinate degradation pathway regulator
MAHNDSDMKIRILLAAKKLFAQQGYDGTSVRQICEEAGANVALVSYYFGGKENVFRALFESFFPGQRIPQYEELLKEPVEGLALIVREVILFSFTDPELSSILQQEMTINSTRICSVTAFTHPVWQKVRELLEKGKALGRFQYDSLDYAMMMVVGIVLAHKKREYFAPILDTKVENGEETANQAALFVLRALGSDMPKKLPVIPAPKEGGSTL